MEINNIVQFLRTIFSFNEAQPLLFTQFYFWAFFAVVFAGFSLIYNKRVLRSSFLFFVSLFFYFKTSGLFVLMLIFAVVYNFYLGKLINQSKTRTRKKIYVAISVLVNLSVMCYFKYAYFFTDIIIICFIQIMWFSIIWHYGQIISPERILRLMLFYCR
jgi:D-alanyl-lipoteichoic acid acyltransferase DltB (MBOAT superfamily)